MANIFEYLDYRQYLRAVFNDKKKEKPRFSHRSLMQKLSLRAPGHMLFVMQGKRRLTEDIALRLAAYLKLNKREEAYLLCLVRYTNAMTPAEKQYSFEEMLSLRHRASAKVSPGSYRFYEKWYHSAIRASLDVAPFSGNYEALAASLCPPITATEARQAVDLLFDLGMVKKDENGFVHPVDSSISTGDTWQSATVHNLQRKFIDLARESLDRVDKDDRDISNLTVTVSAETYDIIKKKVRDLRTQIMDMACAEQMPDRVLQVNVQLFPLQKKNNGGRP
jgi:uncharacterized protein (TIGR02147 family)